MNNYNNHQHSWRLFWIVSIVCYGLTLIPFLSNDYPGLADYANHLARLHLLTDQAHPNWHQFYSVIHDWIPNLALDVIGGYFVQAGLTPELSLRLFSAITVLLVIAGSYCIALSVNKEPPWLLTWVFILIFNRYFSWGFLNYFFSLGLGFLIFSFWMVASKLSSNKLKYICFSTISLLLVFTLLSHLMGYGITLLIIVIYELGISISRENSLSKITKQLSLTSLVFIPSILFYFFVCTHGDGGLRIEYYDFLKSKVTSLLTPFGSYNTTLSIFYFISFIATLYIALAKPFKTKKSVKIFIVDTFPKMSFLIPLILFLLYLMLPSAMMGSAFLDKRFFVVVVLLSLSLAVVKFDAKSTFIVIAISLVSLVAKVYEVNQVWVNHSQAMHQISKAVDQIEVGSKVTTYSFGDTYSLPLPPLQHAGSLAVIQRGAFIPSLFARPYNMESVQYTLPPEKLRSYKWPPTTFKYDSPPSIWTDSGNICSIYDYTLVTYMSKKPSIPDCFEEVASGEYFILYKMQP